MKTIALSLALLSTLAFLSPMAGGTSQKEDEGAVGFPCQVTLQTGATFACEYLGGEGGPMQTKVTGTLNGQSVDYPFHQLKTITHVEGKRIEVVGATGKRVLIDGEVVQHRWYAYPHTEWRWLSNLSYVYLDPVTGTRMLQSIAWREVHSVTIGETAGRSRINPKTKQRWPSHWNFDPLDGSKLVWSDGTKKD
jgi:hypothetical protein